MKNYHFSIFTILIMLQLVTGCSSDENSEVMEPAEAAALGTNIDFSIIASGASGYFSQSSTKIFEIFRDQDSQNIANSLSGYGIPERTIEFESKQTILLTTGRKSNGSHTIAVESVVDYGEYVRLNVLLSVRGSGCAVTAAISHPYQFIEINSRKELVIHESYVVTTCDG